MQLHNRFNIPSGEDFRRGLVDDFALKNGTEAVPWEDPAPLEGGLVGDLPAFPMEALPEQVVRPFTEAVTKTTQVDPGMAGAACLTVLSLCAWGRLSVRLPSHTEPANLYLTAAAPSGERKSEVLKVFTAPVYDFAAEEKERTRLPRLQALNRKAILEKRLEMFRKLSSRAADYPDQVKAEADAMTVSEQLDQLHIPADPCYITSDVTEEKLAVLLSGNGEAIAVVSSEGGVFDIMAGRYSDSTCIDLYLKGHAGDAHQVHRIGREDILLKKPSITMGLMVQPDVIKRLGQVPAFRGQGLLARILYVWCTPRAGTRKLSVEGIPEALRQSYHRYVHDLLSVKFEGPVTLSLSDAARKSWEGSYCAAEEGLLPGGDLHDIMDWGSKLPGAIARIAGLFHFARYREDAPAKLISLTDMEKAVSLGGFFSEHARAVLAMIEEDAQLAGARRILEALKRHGMEAFKVREVVHVTGLKKFSAVKPGLEILMERGWVREIPSQYSGKGRPAAQVYEVHPKAWRAK